jgi:hypothetical protein
MLGTDLFQAYANEPAYPLQSTAQQDNNVETQGDQHAIGSEHHAPPQQPSAIQQMIPSKDQIYDTSSLFKEAQMEQQLALLQQQLTLQKQKMNETKGESVVDRFLSKKKDVLKLVTISMTVLLALSSHYLFTDLIRNYIANNDFTTNQEFTTKVWYPTTILLGIWILKVFNR